MSLPTSPSTHFSPGRPSRLLLDESSLGEAQTKLRSSPNRMDVYMSEAHGDTLKNRHETANPTPYYTDDTGLQGSSAYSAFCHQSEEGLGSEEDNIELTVARIPEDTNDGDSSCAGRSSNGTLKTRRPLKPAKPFFLCAPRSFSFDNMSIDPENFQHASVSDPKKNGEEREQLIHDPNPSLPSNPRTPSRTRLSVNRATRSGSVRTLKRQQGKSRISARGGIWHPPLVSTSHCNPERLPFKLPIGDPQRPFPHPIPTIDRLPLRTESEECSRLEKEKERAKNADSNNGIFTYPKEAFLNWIKTRSFALVSFTLYGPIREGKAQPLPSKRNSYVFCVKTMWSTFDDISTYSKVHGRAKTPQFPKEEPVSLLQISIIVPALLLRIVTLDGVTFRDIRVSTILSVMVRKLKTFFMLVAIFMLLGLDGIRYKLSSRNGRRTT